ncbi:MAG: DUF669 domain-containing protein [Oenococcus sp.]|uniref:DUF669 domain-containing protein n=1 Tax=Oenococcus sp. TaxID=1979414 RepID=UPI0039EC9EDD
MSLNSIFNEIEKFDPSKEKVQSFEGLPKGDYNAIFTKVTYQIPNPGQSYNPSNHFDFEILDGEFAGRHENMQLSFEEVTPNGKPVPDFVLERNGRTLVKLFYILGIQFKLEAQDLLDGNKIVDALKPAIGKKLIVHLDVRENKKNPQYPYRSYDFDPLAESRTSEPKTEAEVEKGDGQLPDISDDDLPFDV